MQEPEKTPEALEASQGAEEAAGDGIGQAGEGDTNENAAGEGQEEAAAAAAAAGAAEDKPVTQKSSTGVTIVDKKDGDKVETVSKRASVQILEKSSVVRVNDAKGPAAAAGTAAAAAAAAPGGNPRAVGAPEAKANVGVWQQVLKEARDKNPETPCAFILILGCEDVGKTSLLRQLQVIGSNIPLSEVELHSDTGGVADMDYAFIGVRKLFLEAEEAGADVETRAHVWMLQDPEAWESVACRLPPSSLQTLSVVICIDLLQAWVALSAFNAWLLVADKIVQRLLEQQSPQEQEALKLKNMKYLSTYRKICTFHALTRVPTDGRLLLQEDAGAPSDVSFDASFGPAAAVAVSVVVTRSDAISCLSTRDNPNALEIFLAFMRHACRQHGAALFFTSCKDPSTPKNVFLLYRYLMHRIYGFPFREQAQLDDEATLFVPAGWDTEAELEALIASTPAQSFDQPYEAFVTRTPTGKGTSDGRTSQAPVSVQPLSAFLAEMQQRHPNAVQGFSMPSLPSSIPAAFQQSQNKAPKEVRMSVPGEGGAPDGASSSGVSASAGVSFGGAGGGSGPRGTEPRSALKTADRQRTSGPSRSSVTLPSANLGSVRSGEGGEQAGDSESLQTFFQSLMAKTRSKGTTTPRDRAKAPFRPKAPPSAGESN